MASGATGVTIEPRKKPKQDRSQGMVERILAAAQTLIGEGGAKALTTNSVAEQAGLSVGSLYQYFPNKEAIVLELARRWLAAFRPIPTHYAEKPPPADWAAFSSDFRAFTRAIARVYEENRALLPILEAMHAHPDLRQIGQVHDQGIVATHAAWFRRVDPTLAADTAERLGLLVLETGHVSFATALTRQAIAYDRVIEDVIVMHEALLARHLQFGR